MEQSKNTLSRGEMELLHLFRNLSPQQQLDILQAAENSYNVQLRMGVLASRDTEKRPAEETGRH